MRPKQILLMGVLGVLFLAPLVFLLKNEEIPLPVRENAPEERSVEEAIDEEQASEITVTAASAPQRTHVFVADTSGTLESVMQERRTDGLLTYTSRLYPTLGSFIESIGGLKNEGGSYWMLYINGTLSSTGVSQTKVERGDHIEWRYE